MKQIKLFAFLLIFASTFSQSDQVGISTAKYLNFPANARSMGFSDSQNTLSKGVYALNGNPANAVNTYKSNFSFSKANYIADIDYSNISYNHLINSSSSIGISIFSVDAGDEKITTTRNPTGDGSTFSSKMTTVGLTYSKKLTDKVSAGLTGKILSETIDKAELNGVAFDIGLSYSPSNSPIQFGLSLKNFGPLVSYSGSGFTSNQGRTSEKLTEPAELPTSFNFSMVYRYTLDEANSLDFSGTFSKQGLGDDKNFVNLEYSYDGVFFIRGGHVFSTEGSASENYVFGTSYGFGLNYYGLTVDYGFQSTEIFDDINMFSISIDL